MDHIVDFQVQESFTILRSPLYVWNRVQTLAVCAIRNNEGRVQMKVSSTGPDGLNIGIIGAGPAGLMTALALEKYLGSDKARVTVLDRNASETDYPGVEYGIQARACRALERIGQLEQACARGNPTNELAFYNSRLGKRFRSVALDPKYTRCVVRQEFLADLAGLLKQTTVQRRHLVQGIVGNKDNGVIVNGTTDEMPFSETFDKHVYT